MNVYPVNAFEGASLKSPQKETYSMMQDLHNRYLAFTVDFSQRVAQIDGEWASTIEADSFIIANTNSHSGHLILTAHGFPIYQRHFETNDFINIIDLEGTHSFNGIRLNLYGNENIQVGLLYIGKKCALPRFVTFPEKTLGLRNESGRTFTGQATGIPVETLRSFAASFVRIPNDEVKIVDEYINGVQKIIPHVVDIYPGAHAEFPPMFMTVAEYTGKEKRAENGFFWNFDLAWMEAR